MCVRNVSVREGRMVGEGDTHQMFQGERGYRPARAQPTIGCTNQDGNLVALSVEVTPVAERSISKF